MAKNWEQIPFAEKSKLMNHRVHKDSRDNKDCKDGHSLSQPWPQRHPWAISVPIFLQKVSRFYGNNSRGFTVNPFG